MILLLIHAQTIFTYTLANTLKLLGVVGISGDTSANDEIAAIAGVKAAGLLPGGA